MQQSDLSSDFFSLFGLPVSFEVDVSALTGRYRELQRAVHPDKHANASDAERRISMQMAARVNEGYQLLRDPLSRARYLLKLRGVQFNDSDTAFDNEFLMEQMELRERLAEVNENSNPEKELQAIRSVLDVRTREIIAQLGEIILNEDADHVKNSVELTRKLQFFRKLSEELDGLEDSLVDI
jgi:molecular chaperone HscB